MVMKMNLFQLVTKIASKENIPVQNVMDSDWDYLIILDACRYDMFNDLYRQFLKKGTLKKVHSKGSDTLEWLKANFKDYYEDIVYISANPYINSITAVKGFKALDHFGKIVDVWKFGWDERLGTVPPKNVTNTAKKWILKYPNKRMIIHYIQPHYPYIASNCKMDLDFNVKDENREVGYRWVSILRDKAGSFLCSKFVWRMTKSLGLSDPRAPLWRMNKLLGGKYASNDEKIYHYFRGNFEKLKELYRENLKIVLGEVSNLLKYLSGKVIITSDHGEGLGDSILLHPPNLRIPILTEVPWFEIEK